jgi:hypothetical protein
MANEVDFEEMARPIQTVYYADTRAQQVLKIVRSKWANNAVPNTVKHLQLNAYGAQLAEVSDLRDSALHAVIRHSVAGEIKILFKRDVHEGM